MSRPLDLSALTRAERLVLVTGALSFANGFVPWWYRTSGPSGTFSYNAGLTGWGTVTVAAGALAAIGVLARAWVWPRAVPRLDGTAYTALGTLAVLATLAQIGAANGHWLGAYVALALAIALAIGGIMRRGERASGWV